MSLRELSVRASGRLVRSGSSGRSRSVSASYLSLIENGRKVPDAAVAVAIGAALGDDPGLYAAWIAARKRADLPRALAAATTLRRMLALPLPERRPGPSTFARLRVPVVPAGLDPGDGLHPGCEVLEWLRLDVRAIAAHHRLRLDRPFAYRLTGESLGRARGWMEPGGCALVLRGCLPPGPEVYAVRQAGRVALARVLWNGRQLLLLPAEGENDFAVLEAAGAASLRALVLGAAVAARFEPEDRP